MPLVSDSIPNLIGGVSQQPPTLRLATQSADQNNTFPSIVEGLVSRPHTHHIAKLASFTQEFALDDARAAKVHTIDRDHAERYVVVFLRNGVRVFGLNDGVEHVVSAPSGFGYLNCASPTSNIRAVTNADYTIVMNNAVEVQMAAAAVDTRAPDALVFVQLANYSTHYSVTLNGYTATVKTTSYGYDASNYEAATGGNGTSAAPVAVSSAEIARQIAGNLAAHTTGFTITQIDSSVWIYRADAADFTIRASDSRSDTQLAAIKGTARRLSELPVKGPDGLRIEIVGSADTEFDNYFVQFSTFDGSAAGEGFWEETYKRGEPIAFDPATMPHRLVREADGTFTFGPIPWAQRKTGSEALTPHPSFVGATINDAFFVRNRLGFLSDESVIESRAEDLFNFFYETATAVLDSDPIDRLAQAKKVSVLNWAVPFGEETFLFADQAQFRLEYGEVMSNETTEVTPKTEYDNSVTVQPAAAPKAIFFASQREGATTLFEYLELQQGRYEGEDITAHVPRLIAGTVRRLAASLNESLVAVMTQESPRTIYLHHYFWAGNDKLQAAWAPITLFNGDAASEIIDLAFIDSRLIILAAHSDGVYLSSMVTSPNQTDPGATYPTLLDRRVSEAACPTNYDPIAKETAITLPYPVPEHVRVVARYPDDHTKKPGTVATIRGVLGSNIVVVGGDWSAARFYAGETFEASYVFSPVYIRKNASDGSQTIITTGRLQLSYFHISYESSGPFEVHVTPSGKPTSVVKMTGRTLGAPDAIIGNVPIASGVLPVPILAANNKVDVRIVTRSHLPIRISSTTWEGHYVDRARRI
jgi:hypothetical protein